MRDFCPPVCKYLEQGTYQLEELSARQQSIHEGDTLNAEGLALLKECEDLYQKGEVRTHLHHWWVNIAKSGPSPGVPGETPYCMNSWDNLVLVAPYLKKSPEGKMETCYINTSNITLCDPNKRWIKTSGSLYSVDPGGYYESGSDFDASTTKPQPLGSDYAEYCNQQVKIASGVPGMRYGIAIGADGFSVAAAHNP